MIASVQISVRSADTCKLGLGGVCVWVTSLQLVDVRSVPWTVAGWHRAQGSQCPVDWARLVFGRIILNSQGVSVKVKETLDTVDQEACAVVLWSTRIVVECTGGRLWSFDGAAVSYSETEPHTGDRQSLEGPSYNDWSVTSMWSRYDLISQCTSGVARVPSARGPMLGSAPPPPPVW